jgi:ribosomal protein S2
VPYPIPANDDGVVGVELIANLLADACLEGRNQFTRNQQLESEGKSFRRDCEVKSIEY